MRTFKKSYPETVYLEPNVTFFSQMGQDAYIASLLSSYVNNEPEDCYVVDVGCNHPVKFSNSYFFERFFGWKTLAIDPLVEYTDLWLQHRPLAIFESYAVGKSNEVMKLYVPKSVDMHEVSPDMYSSTSISNECIATQRDWDLRHVPGTKLSELIDKHHISNMMVCTIDVEGNELDVLEGIDFDRHFIRIFCIENSRPGKLGSDRIRQFLYARGYIFHARIANLDDIFIHKSFLTLLCDNGVI